MTISAKAFFRHVRTKVFGGSMTQPQVDGCQQILTAWQTYYPKGELRWLAYILATAKWETVHTMQPVAEIGRGKGKAYGKPDPHTGHVYYGRGHVQLTWKANYARAGKKLGADFVNIPDLALRPDLSAKIIVIGMVHGWFTGRQLSDYLTPTKADWKGARRIVNGTDRAAEIAALGRAFHDCLLAASDPDSVPDLKPAEKPPVSESTTILASIIAGVTAVLTPLTPIIKELGEHWQTVAVIGAVAIVLAAGWTIRERLQKRAEFGQ